MTLTANGHLKSLRLDIILPAVLSFLAAFSFSFSGTVSGSESLLGRIIAESQALSFVFFACAVMFAWISCRCWETYRRETCAGTRTVAGVLSACMLIGLSYSANNSWSFIFGGSQQFVIALQVFAGYMYFFDFLIVFAYRFIEEDRLGLFKPSGEEKQAASSLKYFLTAAAVIYAGWLLWLIPFLPGSVPHDGAYQLQLYFSWINGGQLNNHHPWVMTVIMGSIVWLGRHVGDNFAIGLAVFVFSATECLIYAYVCSTVRRKFRSAKLYIAFVLFYALVPLFGEYAQALVKDGLYAAVMSLYALIYLEVFSSLARRSGEPLLGSMIRLACVALIASFLRNEGIYIVLGSFAVLLFAAGRRKCVPVILMIALICLNVFAWNEVSKKRLGIVTPFTKEMLSIPLQQTARYLRDYPDDVAPDEKEYLSAFLDYQNLGKVYNPLISDPVKGYNVPVLKRTFKRYLKAWRSMLLKHPDVYIEAVLNHTFGYFYPFCKLSQTTVNYIKSDVLPADFRNGYLLPEAGRTAAVEWYYVWLTLPVLSLFLSAGTYGWFLILSFGCVARFKSKRDMLALGLPVLLFLVCLASPANGFLRYAFPLASTFPVYFCWILRKECVPAAPQLSGGRQEQKKDGD